MRTSELAELQVMRKFDGAYLYEFGARMRRITHIKEEECERVQMWVETYDALSALNDFMGNSDFKDDFKVILKSAIELHSALSQFQLDWDKTDTFKEIIFPYQIQRLKEVFSNFEAVAIAELRSSSLFYVTSKGGFDTSCLASKGEAAFPRDLEKKVPEAIGDVRQAARCIAFELPTAAGFHLHRANECVLRIYWDHVTGGQPRPTEQSMGVYLSELNKLKKGRPQVREHLKSIKDLHRNPLMHPDQTIDSVDDAIDLMSAIRCSIGYMLAEIPDPSDTPLLTQAGL